ncbi:hypothetical protein K2X85_10095 [bacterium]|nr:hypothetical protein [bacterium]
MNLFIFARRQFLLMATLGLSAISAPAQEVVETTGQSWDDQMVESCSGHTCGKCKKPGFVQNIKTKIHNFDKEQLHPDHCWPEQYSRESIRRVYAPLGQQLVNGQRLESMIWEHYFVEEKSAELSEAGKSRLRYLARKRPFIMPQLELQTSFDQAADQQRIAALTQYANEVSTQPISWNVVLVNRGTPIGLFGAEGPKTIDKMIGLPGAAPFYEPQIKRNFMAGEDDE